MGKKSKKVGERLCKAARLRKKERFQKMTSKEKRLLKRKLRLKNETQEQRLDREAGEIVNGIFLAVALLVGLVCIIIWQLKYFG
jgi:hypothetical protein